MIACILVDIARDLLERCARASLLECAGTAVLRLLQVVPDAAIMDCSRGSQEPAIGTDIDIPLRVISEVATGEHAISRWIPFPHGDMRRDVLAQQPRKQFAGAVGGIGCEPIRL